MHHHRRIVLLLIHATLFSISLCENINPNYANCVETFRCGSFSNLSYPFWGGARPLSCGYPGFHLDCGGGGGDGDGDAPLLSISSLSYRLLHINFSSHTLKVARQDLWNDTCPKIILNTSLDPNLFQIPPHLNHANITLRFNCTGGGLRHDGLALGNFSCGGVSGIATINAAADASCEDWISVPVATDTRTASTTNALRDALAGGFFIRWSAEDTGCEDCRRSGGACGYDPAAGTAACYKKSRGRSMQVGAATAAPAAAARAQVAAAPTASPSRRSSAKVWKIIGIVVGVIATHILTAAVVCYIRRRCMERIPNQVCNPDVEKFLLQHGSLASKRYRYSEIKKMTNSFTQKLGQGGYGTVYKGMLPDGCPVAVKVLFDTNGDGENGEEFMNEVASISRTSHVNIVNLLGFCYEGKQQRALIYEFMPNTSLDKFLSKNGNLGGAECGLDSNRIYQIAVGVAKGLEYLHTGCNTRIVHFDIKPQNILLDQEFCPKISDFGLAKLCRKKQSVLSVIGARGTIGYIAPEVFSRNFGGVSHKSDVYSYGMMLLEMAGATIGIDVESEEEVQTGGNCFPDKIYERVVASIDHVGEEEEEEITRKLMLTGFWCIQTMPSERPSISKVVEMLEGSLKSLQIPPKPTLFIQTLAARSEISPFFTSSSLQTEAAIALGV